MQNSFSIFPLISELLFVNLDMVFYSPYKVYFPGYYINRFLICDIRRMNFHSGMMFFCILCSFDKTAVNTDNKDSVS